MNLKIKKIKLENIKGIQSLTYDFTEQTTIQGESGLGKTTILDAINFMLTLEGLNGKTFAHESKRFDGKAFIELELDLDGKETTLLFNNGKYSINGLIMNKTDYASKIKELFGDIQALINPNYITTKLHWEDARKLFTQMLPTMDEQTITNKLLDNGWTLFTIGTATDFAFDRKNVQSTINELKKRLNQLDGALQENQLMGNVDNSARITKIDNLIKGHNESIDIMITEKAGLQKMYDELLTDEAMYDNMRYGKESCEDTLKNLKDTCHVCGNKVDVKAQTEALLKQIEWYENERIGYEPSHKKIGEVIELFNQFKDSIAGYANEISKLEHERKLLDVPKADDRLHELKLEHAQVSGKIETFEEVLELIKERQGIIAETIQVEFKKLFPNFEVVLSKTNKDGTPKDTFELWDNQVPYANTNTGMQIQIGVDICAKLQSFLGTTAPILIDGVESNTKLNTYDRPFIATKAVENIKTLGGK